MRGTDTVLRFVCLHYFMMGSCVTVSLSANRAPPASPHQVNPELIGHFEEKGLHFVGQDVEGERMEVIELDGMLAKNHFWDQMREHDA